MLHFNLLMTADPIKIVFKAQPLNLSLGTVKFDYNVARIDVMKRAWRYNSVGTYAQSNVMFLLRV